MFRGLRLVPAPLAFAGLVIAIMVLLARTIPASIRLEDTGFEAGERTNLVIDSREGDVWGYLGSASSTDR